MPHLLPVSQARPTYLHLNYFLSSVPFTLFVTPPSRDEKGRIICEGFRRNVVSYGGREVFLNK